MNLAMKSFNYEYSDYVTCHTCGKRIERSKCWHKQGNRKKFYYCPNLNCYESKRVVKLR